MENSVLNAIMKRSSIRAYLDKPLSDSDAAALKKAALAAPTAVNRQEQRFVFIFDRSLMGEIEKDVYNELDPVKDAVTKHRIDSRNGELFFKPPLVVLIYTKKENTYAMIDAGIAVENLAIAATGLGLGSVIIGMARHSLLLGNKREEWRERFSVPEGYEFAIAISIGHSATEKEPHSYDESHIISL